MSNQKTAFDVLASLRVDFDVTTQLAYHHAKKIIAALDAAGFVIVPNNDIRPYPLLLSEELLLGLVAHLTAGTADLSIVKTQIARMRAAASRAAAEDSEKWDESGSDSAQDYDEPTKP